MSNFTFEHMKRWSLKQLRHVRTELRNKVSDEINKENALKAEIMYLQNKLDSFRFTRGR